MDMKQNENRFCAHFLYIQMKENNRIVSLERNIHINRPIRNHQLLSLDLGNSGNSVRYRSRHPGVTQTRSR